MIDVSVHYHNTHGRFGKRWVRHIIATTFTHAGIRDAIVGVCFVDDAAMKRYNKKYRKVNAGTDVLAFSFRERQKKQHTEEFGDIIISLPHARKHAQKKGISTMQEVGMLLIHGVLHLQGFTHETDRKEQKMFSMQNAIARRVGAATVQIGKDT